MKEALTREELCTLIDTLLEHLDQLPYCIRELMDLDAAAIYVKYRGYEDDEEEVESA